MSDKPLLAGDAAESDSRTGSRTQSMRRSASKKYERLGSLFDWTSSGQIDRAFCISSRGSSLSTELRAGTTAFLAAGQNFVLNAHIMGAAGLDTQATVVNAAFVCGLTNIACGVLSNLPLGLMPGLGPNVLLAFGLVASHVCNTEQALAVSIVAGLCIFIFALTPVNKLFIGLVPLSVRYGLIIGTGLLSALIGLKSVGVVIADPGDNIVALGSLSSLECRICFIFLVLIVSMLHCAVKGAVLVGMLCATVTYWIVSKDWPSSFLAHLQPSTHSVDFSILTNSEAWVNIAALDLMMRFSTAAALMSSARMADLIRPDGGVNGGTSVYVCCGLGTIVSGYLGSSPVIVSMAASAGIQDGGRTGIVSIVIGVYSILTSLLLSPLLSAIPKCAIAPVLLLVGVSMTGEAAHIEWKKIDRALPAFLCAILQPFTFSVAHGINAGLGMAVVLFFTTGQFIAYMPNLQKRLGVTVDLDRSEGSPFSKHNSRGSSQQDANKEGAGSPPSAQLQPDVASNPLTVRVRSDPSLDVLRIRQGLHDVGIGSRHRAEALVDQVAELMGFDREAVHAIFEERLEVGRHNNFTQYKEKSTLHKVRPQHLTDLERAGD